MLEFFYKILISIFPCRLKERLNFPYSTRHFSAGDSIEFSNIQSNTLMFGHTQPGTLVPGNNPQPEIRSSVLYSTRHFSAGDSIEFSNIQSNTLMFGRTQPGTLVPGNNRLTDNPNFPPNRRLRL